MVSFSDFRSWLKIGLNDLAVSWMEVFVAKAGGFQLLIIVTGDLVLDVAGVLYSLLFTRIC